MMRLSRQRTYDKQEGVRWPIPNAWDLVALLSVIGGLFLLGWVSSHMFRPYHLGDVIPISLSPSHLPYYAMRTVCRMLLALLLSLLCTFIFGTWAAKSKAAERIIIPAIDILQSVPVLGFLSIIVITLVKLTPNSLFGPECAAIFAIFTAQVWNMILSFYQSLRTVPTNLCEAATMFRLSAWQRFWRLEVPFAMPGLLWNTMMSMSGSWVFLVASEAITVGNQNITLPGIGSYIALATEKMSIRADSYALIAMLLVIIVYDQVMFRPLVAWSEKFNTTQMSHEVAPQSWLLNLFQRARFCRSIAAGIGRLADGFINISWFLPRPKRDVLVARPWAVRLMAVGGLGVVWLIIFALIAYGINSLMHVITWAEMKTALLLGFYTGLRVIVLIALSILIWVPIGVWIGLRPRVTQIVQPVAQFFAAFPINLIFPFAVYAIVHFHLNIEIWCAPLMILGTQWYILFNVIAGASVIPKDMHYAAHAFDVRGLLWWRRVILPAIFPYVITGAITAAGGAWNISIIAEALSWGKTHLYAQGLGAYIDQMASAGHYSKLALGIVVMSVYVVAINRFFWQPLYKKAADKFQIR